MIYTCDNCLSTFPADAIPTSCPDCGKKTVTHRIGGKEISFPAVREATDREKEWYHKILAELAEGEQPRLSVQLSDVIEAIVAIDDESEYCLDLETGEIVWTNTMAMSYREREEISERLEEHGFIRLPSLRDRHDYRIIEDFAASLPAAARNQLSQAMRGKGGLPTVQGHGY